MEGLEQFLQELRLVDPALDANLIASAYEGMYEAHLGQKRETGEPYYTHPREVARILLQYYAETNAIAAALLHDTVEDVKAVRDDISGFRARYGDDVYQLVDALTKLERIGFASRKTAEAEGLRKLFMAIAQDERVVYIKLADRLHNMRTLDGKSDERAKVIALDTQEIYAPLAERFGIEVIKNELDDLSFKILHPKSYEQINDILAQRMPKIFASSSEIMAEIKEILEENNIPATVNGRVKSAYSIYRKMQRQGITFDRLSDIYAFRVIVDTPADCYTVFGLANRRWPAVHTRLRDFISNPKENGYQSLHTTVVGLGSQHIEIQIRTHAMHEVAEKGIAAHHVYKVGRSTSNPTNKAYKRLRDSINILNDGDYGRGTHFDNHMRHELMGRQIYTVTPKGHTVALPEDATPIDFAYAIHSDVGDHCVGCRINGRSASLMATLKDHDEVDIIVDPDSGPPLELEGLAATGRARHLLGRLKRGRKRQWYIDTGKELLKLLFDRRGKKISKTRLTGAARRLARSSLDDLYVSIAKDGLDVRDVFAAAYPDYKEDLVQDSIAITNSEVWFAKGGGGVASDFLFHYDSEEQRKRVAGAHVEIAAGGVVIGDRLVAVLIGDILTIYPIDHPALSQVSDQEWVDVRWVPSGDKSRRYQVEIVAKLLNWPGSLAAAAEVISNNDANISAIVTARLGHDFLNARIELDISSSRQLLNTLADLRALQCAREVERNYLPHGRDLANGARDVTGIDRK